MHRNPRPTLDEPPELGCRAGGVATVAHAAGDQDRGLERRSGRWRLDHRGRRFRPGRRRGSGRHHGNSGHGSWRDRGQLGCRRRLGMSVRGHRAPGCIDRPLGPGRRRKVRRLLGRLAVPARYSRRRRALEGPGPRRTRGWGGMRVSTMTASTAHRSERRRFETSAAGHGMNGLSEAGRDDDRDRRMIPPSAHSRRTAALSRPRRAGRVVPR